MYKLNNLYNKAPLTISVEHGNKKVIFDVHSLLSKRNKEELFNNQFDLLEEYLNYKGDIFKSNLIDKYLEADDKLMLTITNPDIYPLPLSISYQILDLFDYNDVLSWVINIRKVPTLPNLADAYNISQGNDNEFTRAQTYLKSEYLELVAFSIIIKTVIPVIAHFGSLKNSEIAGTHKEYILYNFILGHPIAEVPPAKRLFMFINKLVEIAVKETTLTAIRIIEKRIPKEEMSNYMMSVIVLNKVAIASVVNDTPNRNMITIIYTYVNNKLSVKADAGNAIREKTVMGNENTDDQESIIESFRTNASLSEGKILELNWSLSNLNIITGQLDVDIPPKLLMDATEFCKEVFTNYLAEEQILILSYIFKNIIDPRAIELLSIDSIYNLIVVAFGYLYTLGFKYLAILITAIPIETNNEIMYINTTVNRSRLPIEVKDTLQTLFPYNRVINAKNKVNLAEETINDLANEIFSKQWRYTVDDKYLNGVPGAAEGVPSDLKIQLANLLIHLETRKEYDTYK